MTTSWSIEECQGNMRLAERGPKNDDDRYTAIEFLDQATNIELVIMDRGDIINLFDEDVSDDTVCGICLDRHHVENPETERTFHAQLRVYLNKKQLRDLHGYLGFLLETNDG